MSNIRNIILGFCEIFDGLIRIITLGFVHTKFAFYWLVWWEENISIPEAARKLKSE